MTEEEELRILSTEIAKRRRELIDAYKETHSIPSRGTINTPEIRALFMEEKKRYFEIIKKHRTD